MMMKPTDFLETATEFLQKKPLREVDCRNAASRAYYCALHSCRDLLEQSASRISVTDTSHQKIIRELQANTDRLIVALGNKLFSLKSQRNDADYKLDQKFTFKDAERLVQHTRNLLQEIQNIQSAN